MSIIIRLQNLPWSANSLDIRKYFNGLSIPEGGVHIVGGDKGDAFIAFSTDEDARQAMERDGGKVKEIKIKLLLSSRTEMQKVIEQARSHCMPPMPAAPPPVLSSKSSRDRDRSRSPDHSRRNSPDRRRERDRSPKDRDRERSPKDRERDRDRDKSKSSTSSKSSSRKDKSRSRSPRKTRDRDRERDRDQDKEKDKDKDKDKDKERRSSKRDDRKRSDDSSTKGKEEPSRQSNSDNRENRSSSQSNLDNRDNRSSSQSNLDNRDNRSSSSFTTAIASNGAGGQFSNSISSRPAPTASRSSLATEQPFIRSFNQIVPQPTSIDPWIDKVPVWEAPRLPIGNTLPVDTFRPVIPTDFRPVIPADFRGRDSFSRTNDTFSSGIDSFSRPEALDNDRGRFVGGSLVASLDQVQKSFGLPPVFEAANNQRRQEQYGDSSSSFSKQSLEDQMGKSYRAFDSDQRMVTSPQLGLPPQLPVAKPSPGYADRMYDSGLSRGLGYCIEVRGLPYSVSYKDVRDLFRGVYIATDGLKLINDESGQRTGTAIIRLTTQRDVNEALKRNKQYVGDSYIDVFRCTDNVFDSAVDSYLPPGMRKPIPQMSYSQMPPRPDDLCVLMKGLPYGCTEDDVIHFFDGLRILDLYIEVEFSGRTTGCAFVEFGTVEDYHAAMAMNRRNIGHRYIELSIASKDMIQVARRARGLPDTQNIAPPIDRDRVPPKELLPLPQPENRNSLCVGLQGLPFNVTDRDIADFFADIAVPLAIHIMLGPNRMPTGEAFVEFTSIQHFDMAMAKNGQFVGQSMVKLFRIPYEDMMEILGTPVVRNESLLGKPLNEPRGGPLNDDQDMMTRPMMNRPRPVGRGLDDASNSPRQTMSELRGFIRDSLPLRGMSGDLTRDALPVRGDLRDGLPRIGLPGDRDLLPRSFPVDRDVLPTRGLPSELRDKPVGRLMMDQDRGLPHRGVFLGDRPGGRHLGRPTEPELIDDSDRHRRFPDDISNARSSDSPDPRGHGRLPNGPMDRSADGKASGRHILDAPHNRVSDDMHDHGPPRGGPGGDYGPEGRMPRGPPMHGGPTPPDRRRMPPNGQTPTVPEGFGKPGCVIGASNIPYRATAEELLGLFKDHGVTKEKLIRRFDNMGRMTGDARIAFATPEEAQKVVTELNGKMFNGRPISLFIM